MWFKTTLRTEMPARPAERLFDEAFLRRLERPEQLDAQGCSAFRQLVHALIASSSPSLSGSFYPDCERDFRESPVVTKHVGANKWWADFRASQPLTDAGEWPRW